MKKSFRFLSLAVVLLLVLSLGVVACQRPAKPTPYNNTPNNDMNRNINNNNINRDINDNNMNTDLSDRADKIANNVANLKEVNSATVVISGNTAIVGVDIKNQVEGNLTTDLKKKVEKTVRNTDKSITNVTVTADADLFKRIQNIGRDIRTGKPISGFGNEIEEIIRRITPSM
ncbi:YhcN/YlaJ family sporulation lipoprotein [Brassicibacter mesophilus]|uniref:YhcN/YlaJ family sporulation lipoprotein n=1 Tax=Brassicibacter mesophilus TaxID=745119 RepID=UPI003D1B80A0